MSREAGGQNMGKMTDLGLEEQDEQRSHTLMIAVCEKQPRSERQQPAFELRRRRLTPMTRSLINVSAPFQES